MSFRPCILIPTYNNPRTIRAVVVAARAMLSDVVVVDDGGNAESRAELEALHAEGLAIVVHREKNGGKGAAVKTGFEHAAQLGFTHALQVDGDGQHDLRIVDAFLEAGKNQPHALVIGYPEYDASVPRHRLIARQFTNFWVNLEVGGKGIVRDAMIGVRLYPLAIVRQLSVWGDRMDFDVEVAVRYAWTGLGIVNLPVPVRYLAEDEGGVSHFRVFGDNLRFSFLHSRLCITRMMSLVFRRSPRLLLP